MTKELLNRLKRKFIANNYRERKKLKLLASLIVNGKDNHMVAMEVDLHSDKIKKEIHITNLGTLQCPLSILRFTIKSLKVIVISYGKKSM